MMSWECSAVSWAVASILAELREYSVISRPKEGLPYASCPSYGNNRVFGQELR